jgi:hypothetical protein
MIVCDKCKKGIKYGRNEINFKTFEYRTGGYNLIPKSQLQSYGPVEHNLKLDVCQECQEKIIQDIIGYVPWRPIQVKEGE